MTNIKILHNMQRKIWFRLREHFKLNFNLFTSTHNDLKYTQKATQSQFKGSKMNVFGAAETKKPRPRSKRGFVAGLEKGRSWRTDMQPRGAWAVLHRRTGWNWPDVQPWLRSVHIDSVLWLKPKVHPLNHGWEEVITNTVTCFALYILQSLQNCNF